MSYIEDKFYRKDKKEYQLDSNQGFIKWLKMSEACGLRLHPEIQISDMQGIIDHLNNDYHIKYPDYILDEEIAEEERKKYWRERINQLGDMDSRFSVSQMLSYLPLKERYLSECRYSVKTTEIYGPFYDTLYIYDKKNHEKKDIIQFDPLSGIVITSSNESYENRELESILDELIKKSRQIDYHELEDLVNNNCYERVIRYQLFQLTALKILYTSSTPKIGYERAKRFIEEMNREFEIELSTKDIDTLYYEYKEEREKYPRAFSNLEVKKQSIVPKGSKVLRMTKENRIYTE